MKINSISPSFGKTHVNSSAMNYKQEKITNYVLSQIDYNDEFQKADENNVDLYFLPDGKKGIKVYCVDVNSQQVIRDEKNRKNKYLFNLYSSVSDINNEINSLLKFLHSVNTNKIARPEINDRKIANGITDVAHIRPELYRNLSYATDNYISYFGLDRDDAYNITADDFLTEYNINNVNDDF